jgi:phospholipid/cholesterol/gamma-HCH transport system substrate-binding protein
MASSYSPEPQVSPPRRNRWLTLLIVSTGLIAIAGFSLLKISSRPRLRLRACFQDVNGLRPGARVRLAGVDVGVVRDVRAQPTDQACPGAVEIELRRDLKIPEDSLASVETEGVLGPSFLEIDVVSATGPALRDGGLLPSKESEKLSETFNRALTKAVDRLTQLLEQEKSRKGERDKTLPAAPPSNHSAAPAQK